MMNNMDRISLLPDALLHQILSFLNIRSVIQTCVLSKRWKNLWTEVPTLNFDFDSFPFDAPTARVPSWKYAKIKLFIAEIFSGYRCKSVQKLTYSSSVHNIEAVLVVELLLTYDKDRPVRELCLNTFHNIYYDWPTDFLKCSNLTVLKMTCGFVPDWRHFDSCRLRILEVQFDWEEWVLRSNYKENRSLTNCTGLESLVLVNCRCQNLSISAPNLENFELSVASNWKISFPRVNLVTPKLRNVKFSNVFPTIIKSDSGFPRIHNVNIALDDSNFDGGGLPTKKLTEFSHILQVFHNARSFALPSRAMEVLLSVPSSLNGCSFHNLRRLKLKTEATSSVISFPISMLMNSLQCPNLETLEVDLNERDQKMTKALKALIETTHKRDHMMSLLSKNVDDLKETDRRFKERITYGEFIRLQGELQ